MAVAALRRALMEYVVEGLQDNPPSLGDPVLSPLIALMPRGNATSHLNILSQLEGREEPAPVLLSTLYPTTTDPLAVLHSLARDPATLFDAYTSAARRTASEVRGRLHEPGVSLYHEFKVLSALGHVVEGNPNGIADGCTVILGDFPGIQKMIYTVTSKGAAKTVRGRSFFLQLLTDCVVYRLLADLGDLPITNALITAGGRFSVVAPAGVISRVEEVNRIINRALLKRFFGDITLTLSAAHLSIEQVIQGNFPQMPPKRPFRTLLDDQEDFESVFGTFGAGSKYSCAVSRREPTSEELEEAVQAGSEWIAPENRAFRTLADALADVQGQEGYLVYSPHISAQAPDYVRLLHDICGWSCQVVQRSHLTHHRHPDQVVLRLGSGAFDPAVAQGFRFFALHTPLTMPSDVEWRAAHPDGEEPPRMRDIRSFDLLAGARATGTFVRLGVLRMDVDSLGDVFGRTLTLTQRVSASDALSLFFESYLPVLCAQIEQETDRPNALYLIYGGGDDLFVVGEWDLLPEFAQRLHDHFDIFSGGTLTISAGIVLVPLHFPFYRAADVAGSALEEHAKAFANGRKNAVHFMGVTTGWAADEDWSQLTEMHARIRRLEDEIGTSSITHNIYRIYTRWNSEHNPGKRITVGRYTWQAAYQIARLKSRYKQHAAEIDSLMKTLLSARLIYLSGAAARWAEYERRIHDSHGMEQTND